MLDTTLNARVQVFLDKFEAALVAGGAGGAGGGVFPRHTPSPSHAFGAGPSLSRGAGEGLARQQVGDFGHDLVGQELHRMVPGFGGFAVVEAEQQEVAEAADLFVHPLDLFDDGLG